MSAQDEFERNITRIESLASSSPEELQHEISKSAAEVLEICREMSTSSDSDVRRLVADALGGLGLPEAYAFVKESLEILLRMMQDETVLEVQVEIVHSLGVRGDASVAAVLIEYAGSEECKIRIEVAKVLSFLAEGSNLRDIVDALIVLANDAEPEVREWGTLALATHMFIEDIDDP